MRRRSTPLIILLGLALITAAVYSPAWRGGLVWDDDGHLTSEALRGGEGLRRIWLDVRATQQYYPVVHSAFWLMDRLWGANVLGYHLVNIAMHALAAWLVGLVLSRLKVPGAWIAALLFAVHPVHVESVAWMTELKNTLSAVLGLSSVLVYLTFDESRRPAQYGLALALFVLGLLSKSVIAMLAPALLVIFWWQRGRIDWRRDVVPLVPFIAAGFAGGLLTAWVERSVIGAHGADFQWSVIDRVLIAGRVVWFYLWTLIWPAGLAFIYPRWQIDPGVWWQYLFPAGLVGIIAAAWWWRTRSRTPLAVLLLFCGLLFPVLGFFNVYPFRYSLVANHFQYLASIPILAVIGAGVAALVSRRTRSGVGVAVASAIIAAPLAVLTWQDAHQYVDEETLYRATIERNPACFLCYTNLGDLNLKRDRPDLPAAIANLQTALQLNKDNPEAHNSLGLAWQQMGRLDAAMAEHQEALRLSPEFALATYNLGYDLQLAGRLQEAVRWYERTLEIQPDSAKAHNNLSNVLLALGRPDEAFAHLEEARRLAPSSPEIQRNVAIALHRRGRLDEAVIAYREVLRLNPHLGEVHSNLGSALRQLGRNEEALAEFRESVRLMPNSPDAHRYFAGALVAMDRPAEAVTEYEAALAHARGDMAAELHNDLGVALARAGRPNEAITHFRQALQLKPDFAAARTNLTALLAGNGGGVRPRGQTTRSSEWSDPMV